MHFIFFNISISNEKKKRSKVTLLDDQNIVFLPASNYSLYFSVSSSFKSLLSNGISTVSPGRQLDGLTNILIRLVPA